MERSFKSHGARRRLPRALLLAASLVFCAVIARPPAVRAQHEGHGQQQQQQSPPPKSDGRVIPAHGGVVPVHTPDVPRLPWTTDNGVKVFHLTAEVVETELIPGKKMFAWGYNGSVPGPTVEVNEGDRVRFVFHNKLPEATSMHWHGLEVPMEMDGVPFMPHPPVEPGGTFTFEFTLRQNGTFFYHSHMAMQEMMGMIGLFIIHPKRPHAPRVDRDFGLILQEWALLPNNPIPNTLPMEFNCLTIN